MSWRTARFCVNCKTELSYSVVMYSHGRCPACGFKHPSACTVVKTFERAYRNVHDGEWWQFWIPARREYLEEQPAIREQARGGE